MTYCLSALRTSGRASLRASTPSELVVRESWRNDNEHTDNCCFIGCTVPIMNVAQPVYFMVVKNVPQQICLVTCDLERSDTSPVKSLHIFTHVHVMYHLVVFLQYCIKDRKIHCKHGYYLLCLVEGTGIYHYNSNAKVQRYNKNLCFYLHTHMKCVIIKPKKKCILHYLLPYPAILKVQFLKLNFC